MTKSKAIPHLLAALIAGTTLVPAGCLFGACSTAGRSAPVIADASRGPVTFADSAAADTATTGRPDVGVAPDATKGEAVIRPGGNTWVSVASPTMKRFRRVWGSGQNDVWAVGGKGYGDEPGIMLRWNGTAWSSVAASTLDERLDHQKGWVLLHIWGTGPDDVWASGVSSHANGGGGGWVLHWNGALWSPVGKKYYWLRCESIWGSGPNNVWVAGAYGQILRWNGTAVLSYGDDSLIWKLFFRGAIRSVWGSGPNNVWFAGTSGKIVRWNGSAWAPVPSGTTQSLNGVWGSSQDDVWAVGDRGTILRWNGAAWRPVPSGTAQDLYAVWGSSANDIWAVGEAGTLLHYRP